jgi:hypothetical protein
MTPDSGIWEFRRRKRIHTHSAAMVLGRLPAA